MCFINLKGKSNLSTLGLSVLKRNKSTTTKSTLSIASLCPTQDTACLGLVHGDDPGRCCGEGGGRGGSCLGAHVHPWWIHVNVWQNEYSIAK